LKNLKESKERTKEEEKKLLREKLMKEKWLQTENLVHPMATERTLDGFDLWALEVIKQLNTWKKKRTEEGSPEVVDVLVKIFVNEIRQLSTVEELLDVTFTVMCWWKEECLVGDDDSSGHPIYPEKYGDDFGYLPKITVIGDVSLQQVVPDDDIHSMEFLWSDFGIVCSERKYHGTIRAPMDLKHFPFDCQKVKIILQSDYWEGIAVFHNVTPPKDLELMTGGISLIEWDIHNQISVHDEIWTRPTDGMTYSRVVAELTVKRKLGYYLQKIVSLVVLILFLMIPSFALSVDSFNDRFTQIITLLLSAVAFNFVVAEATPKISYTTHLDWLFFFTYACLGISSLLHSIIFFLYHISEEMASNVNYYSASAFAFAACLAPFLFLFRGLNTRKCELAASTPTK